MNIELKRLKEAPENGNLLAYFRKGIVYTSYQRTGDVIKAAGEEWEKHKTDEKDELLELHLFNDKREYRSIKTKSKNYIETVISDSHKGENAEKDMYLREDMYLEEKYKKMGNKIRVINYIDYTLEGMLKVTNYRLAVIKEM